MTGEQLAAAINSVVGGAVVKVTEGTMPSATLQTSRLIQVCNALKHKLGFNYLISVTGVDYCTYFEVVYHLQNIPTNEQACIKVVVDHDQPVVPSVYGVWPGADFQEREVYDLMGISFTGHPNLKRILLWDEFKGHPLQKAFGMFDEDAWRQAPSLPELEV
ncbi:MAG: NADH-quinone oxidoreductase subunit C [Bacteroidetes bacterium]|nr:NADH-quinone oxidoreductase subunit C [Bacteroidota bacterium]